MRKVLLIILLLLCLGSLFAQEQAAAPTTIEDLQLQIKAMSDSLLTFKEQEVVSEFGFRETDTLAKVLAQLQIADAAKWKNYLGLEPENISLDKMSLRRLGITPYRALLAKQYSIFGYTELNTIFELAQQTKIPIKQLRQFAGKHTTDKSFDSYSLQALGIQPESVLQFEKDFAAGRLKFGWSITLWGVLIVFLALTITAVVIGQLRRLNGKPRSQKNKIVLDASGRVISEPQDLNANVIAAAITALHLYKQGIADRRLLLLTFRRARANQWHNSGDINMPNRNILRKRS